MMDSLFDEIMPEQGKNKARVKAEQRELLEAAVRRMEQDKRCVILGAERMRAINKRVGERFRLTGINFKDIDLEFEIIGVFPDGRFSENAVMNRDYLNDALLAYPKSHAGQKHALADKSLHIVWLQVADKAAYGQIAQQVESSHAFRDPPVKVQTLSSGIASRLDLFRDLIWGMRWLLAPAVLVTMALVISNAISISVRERRSELAVLKVLGFRPAQILGLVLGEALVIGAIGGLLSALLTYWGFNAMTEIYPIPLAVPSGALWWGPAIGALTALAGSALPAWSATNVKVSEVFARVT
jgi:putative ABC transport system permease protein